MENANHMENGRSTCNITEPCSSTTKTDGVIEGSPENPTTGTVTAGSPSLNLGSSIAGLLIHSTNEKMSIYQAFRKNLLPPGAALLLLEAQAATGFLIDPVTEQKLPVDEALQAGVIGPDVYNKLLSAEKAVSGYRDPTTGNTISLFQAMKEELVVSSHGIRLLEAQLATGGIIDPTSGQRISVEVAYQRGMFDQEMNKILSDPSDDTRGFFDPNTQENLSYLELKQRCVTESSSGLCLLIITDKVVKGIQISTDEQTKSIFRKTLMSVKAGRFRGRKVTLWEVINSEYFTADQISEFIKDFKSGKTTVEKIITVVTTTIEQTEREKKVATFHGLRRKVTAQELLESKVIDQNLYNKLEQGITTVKDVTELQSVGQYLTGTCSIAGVLVESTNEKLSIYQAMRKRLLMPGTALVLLEAQAATGFVIDPVKNVKLTVDEAVQSGLVGKEFHEKLLSAERAVTGYKDPYTGNVISLFQALKKDLIVHNHGIRLLEAQIATGGIIDPVHSHRLPVDMAYKRGMFDEQMNKILSDAGDDTKGFFDPNTKENLTYLQLKQRCVNEQETGLCLLRISDGSVKNRQGYSIAEAQSTFQQETIHVSCGRFKGRSVSIWEIIHSEYFTEEKRKELIEKYRLKEVDMKTIITRITTTIEQTESQTHPSSPSIALSCQAPLAYTAEETEAAFRKTTISFTIWSLLHSKLFTEEERRSLIEKYSRKEIDMETVIRTITRMIEQTQCLVDTSITFSGLRADISLEELVESEIIDQKTLLDLQQGKKTVQDVSELDSVKVYLRGSDSIAGVLVESTNEKLSIYQAMKKHLLMPGTALVLLEAQAATGFVIDPVKNVKLTVDEAVQSGLVGKEFHEKLLSAERAVTGYKDPYTGNVISLFQALKKELIVHDHGIRLLEAQIATGGIIDPVHSHRLPVDVAYRRGMFDEQMNKVLSDAGDDTKGFFDPNTKENLTYLQLKQRCAKDPVTDLYFLLLRK